MKIILICPHCGKQDWINRDDGFECKACGEFSYPENMCSEVIEDDSPARKE